MQPIWAVGLMTGTVLDGNIDVALLRTDGEAIDSFGPYTLTPYPASIRTLLEATLAAARQWNFDGPEPAIFAAAEDALTRAQSAAVLGLVVEAGLTPADIGIIGFHGQSVLHRAPQPGRIGATRQLGDGRLMRDSPASASLTICPPTCAPAGRAPLAALYHRRCCVASAPLTGALPCSIRRRRQRHLVDGGDRLIAFDAGPPTRRSTTSSAHGLGDMDRDGAPRRAARGRGASRRPPPAPYLSAPYPKSLDRFDFLSSMADGLGVEDGAATLTAFTTSAVGRALDLLPRRPERLVVCGGGRRNPTIMRMLRERAGVEAVPAEAVGWRGDAIEAECFAFLAVRVLRGLPISFPTTTGAPPPLTGSVLAA